MHPNQHVARRQPVLDRIGNTDALGSFDLLPGPQLLVPLAVVLLTHRERPFPPTETLKRTLVIASYPIAWAMFHRLRSVFARPNREQLSRPV